VSDAPAGGWPRITVITPCRNAERYIAETVESVRGQNYPELEHLILDAASTDGTLAILARYPGLRVISEADKGSHDAMNKGLGLAAGEIIGFINADDTYAEGILREIGHAFAEDPSLDVAVVGTVIYEDADGMRKTLVARDHATENGFWLAELAFGAPGFNGRFFRRRLFERVGTFNLAYYFSADRNFLMRLALANIRSRSVPGFGYFFRSHPGSFTLNAMQRNAMAFAREHIPQALGFAEATRDQPDRRRLFLAWHAFDSAKLVYFELSSGRLKAALAAAARLCRDDPIWPFRLPLAFALRHAVRRAEARSTALAPPVPL
jgi:glycosyltransferase involved in cell wall biosynthesis